MSYIYYYYGSTEANGAIHEERSIGVGSDGIVEIALLLYIL